MGEAAAFLKANTKTEDGIFLYHERMLCLYFLAERFPPTKVYMDDQFLPENKDGPGLLAEGLASLRAHPPKFVIMSNSQQVSSKARTPEIDAFVQTSYQFLTNFGEHAVLAWVPDQR